MFAAPTRFWRMKGDPGSGVLEGLDIRAKTLFCAVGEAPQPFSAELVCTGVDLAGDVRDLQGDIVRVSPARCQAQEVAERPGCSKERIRPCGRRCVVRSRR